MKRKELKNRIQQSFLELAPDVYDQVKDSPLPQAISKEQESVSERKWIEKWNQRRKWLLYVGVVAACLLLVLKLNTENNNNNIYVVMDVAPSVRLTINENYEIEQIEGLDKEGKNFVKELAWEKKENVQQGMENIVDLLYQKQLLEDNCAILVTIQDGLDLNESEVKERLQSELQQNIERKNVKRVVLAFQTADEKTKQSGRRIIEKDLIEKYGMDKEECQRMSVTELVQCYQEKQGGKLEMKEVSAGKDIKKKDTTTNKNTQNENKQKEKSVTEQEKKQKKADTQKTEKQKNSASSKNTDEKDTNKKEQQNKKETVKDINNKATTEKKDTQEKNIKEKTTEKRETEEKRVDEKTPEERVTEEKRIKEKATEGKTPEEKIPDEKIPDEKMPEEKTPEEKRMQEERNKEKNTEGRSMQEERIRERGNEEKRSDFRTSGENISFFEN